MFGWFRARGSSSNVTVRSLATRLDDVEEDIVSIKTKHENLRGSLLTLSRRVTRLTQDLIPDDDEDEDEEDPFVEELERRRRDHG